jgi:hypothetical protein
VAEHTYLIILRSRVPVQPSPKSPREKERRKTFFYNKTDGNNNDYGYDVTMATAQVTLLMTMVTMTMVTMMMVTMIMVTMIMVTMTIVSI